VSTTTFAINIKRGLIKTQVEFIKNVVFYNWKTYLWRPKKIMTKENLIGQLNFP
jgi:hypothetical protein